MSTHLDLSLDDALEELEGAEDFLNYFGIDFDQTVVHINRLHIMQRYHDYLEKAEGHDDLSAQARFSLYRRLLERAYQDFVDSDALTEKVFKVFRQDEPQTGFVPLDQILG